LDVVFLQTADPYRYKRMLDATARTITEYCRRHGYAYESYVGIKRGYFPWHATFNRMFQFRELVDREFPGWAVYLDADAYINDLDFDLDAYLGRFQQRAGVMTTIPGSPHPWCINAGVILLNLGNASAREIVRRWLDKYLQIEDDRLRGMSVWDDSESDQSMLFDVLCEDSALRDAIHYDDGATVNSSEAMFIRQLLRSLSPDIDTRTNMLEALSGELLSDRKSASLQVVAALYRGLLRREPDDGGLSSYVRLVDASGLEEGTRLVAHELVHSDEYKALQR
jgi:hypothetical protein